LNASSTYHFDVALSFAGEERDYVSRVADELKSQGIRVFYDKYYDMDLWRVNLDAELTKIYSRYSFFVIMFLSEHYLSKRYTNLERKAAEERALRDEGEYIMAVRFDDSDIQHVSGAMTNFDISGMTPKELSGKIAKKIRDTYNNTSTEVVSSQPIARGKIKSTYHLVTSPMFGTILFSNGYSIQPMDWDGAIPADFQFYGDQPRFINVGDKVKKWQMIFKIASMGYANEFESDVNGTIIEILVEDGQAIELDQPIMKICVENNPRSS